MGIGIWTRSGGGRTPNKRWALPGQGTVDVVMSPCVDPCVDVNTIEVGVFTGCSLLATALALPDDGKVVAIDVNREYYELGRPFLEKAGVAHKVDFREGPALDHLDALLADARNVGAFDFAFLDADKPSYALYHERLLRLVRVGGAVVYDNTLWDGTVALPPDAPLSDHDRRISAAMRDLNARLTVADGVTICRRVA